MFRLDWDIGALLLVVGRHSSQNRGFLRVEVNVGRWFSTASPAEISETVLET